MSIFILLALLRFGFIVEYSEVGLEMWVKAGFLRLRLKDKDEEKKPKKKKPKKKKEKKPGKKGPGGLGGFFDILRAVKKSLDRLRRKLLIKQLTIYYTSASDDPSKTALQFGAANAVFGAIIPALERNFKIKRRDLRAAADFNAKENGIYAKIVVSIAVWEVVYIVFALFPLITAMAKSKPDIKSDKKDMTDRKEVPGDGKKTDK